MESCEMKKSRKPFYKRVGFWAVILLTAFAVFVIASSSGSNNVATAGTSKDTDISLCDTDNIKATFQRVYEEPSITGAFYLQILVENKTDKTIWVALENASVNGYSTTIMSGIPMTINPGEKSKSPFIISYKNLNADKLSEVNNIKFSIHVYNNDDMSSIAATDQLSIDVSH